MGVRFTPDICCKISIRIRIIHSHGGWLWCRRLGNPPPIIRRGTGRGVGGFCPYSDSVAGLMDEQDGPASYTLIEENRAEINRSLAGFYKADRLAFFLALFQVVFG